mgnify:FL=1
MNDHAGQKERTMNYLDYWQMQEDIVQERYLSRWQTCHSHKKYKTRTERGGENTHESEKET